MSLKTFLLGRPEPWWQRVLRFVPAIIIISMMFHVSSQSSPRRSAVIKALSPKESNGKLLHAVAYAGLGVAFCWGYSSMARRMWLLALLAWSSATAYGVLDEVHQSFVRSRTGSATDAAIDSVGALAGCTILAGSVAVWQCLRRHTDVSTTDGEADNGV